jgi:methionyl-tRNA formyltransferase
VKTRIVFITPEEPSVVTSFFRRVIPELEDRIAAIAVVSPIYKNSSWLKQAKRFKAAFGMAAFIIEGAHFVLAKLADRMNAWTGLGRPRSVKGAARAHGLRLLEPDDVNGAPFLETLRELEPDLVISVSCPQIFKDELLELPRIACVNVHSSLLPHYRGMLPTFWVLAKGETETGVTVMYMNPGIDDGDIILQRPISIAMDETLRSLMSKCKEVAADLVIEAVEQFENESIVSRPNPAEAGSYYSFPKREDVVRFRALGRALR